MTNAATGVRRASRREFLWAGGLALSGLALPQLLQARAASPVEHGTRGAGGRGFGRAKACIFLFMSGGPSHLDTWDMKPDLPSEFRGEFKPVATRIPGTQICEHFPRLAQLTDRYTILRSLSHRDSNHPTAPHLLLTGRPPGDEGLKEWPCYGSVLAHRGRGRRDLPAFVRLRPSVRDGPEDLNRTSRGTAAGWLGKAHDPFTLDGDLLAADFRSDNLMLRDDISPDRLQDRRGLLDQLAERADYLERGASGRTMQTMYDRAYQIYSSTGARKAFDISREPAKVRERYGANLHGHCVLLARRLVEAGVPLVTVFYQNDLVGSEDSTAWDTHGGNFPLLKNLLMPAADRALSALLEDLELRGMLDETLVVWTGEFGREPKITKPGLGNSPNWGRNHWPQCFSGVLAGGGIRGGRVYGSSDRTGAYPKDKPVSPADLAATIYHCLGVDPQIMLPDVLGRPHPLGHGRVLVELLT